MTHPPKQTKSYDFSLCVLRVLCGENAPGIVNIAL